MELSDKKKLILGAGGGAGILVFGFLVPSAFVKALLIALAVDFLALAPVLKQPVPQR